MQRVAIARAIVNDPKMILADEPTGALDSKTSVLIMDLLKEISRDRLVVTVTHNDELAAKYATRTIKMRDGQVVSDSAPYAGKTKRSISSSPKILMRAINRTLATNPPESRRKRRKRENPLCLTRSRRN